MSKGDRHKGLFGTVSTPEHKICNKDITFDGVSHNVILDAIVI